ncbi:MAG TPA: hypothetical protein DDW90_09310 [Cyanobacteria bacterium UBA9971]|nr:hypothetical protein [Cyanobacteria bacterium UBA9971]
MSEFGFIQQTTIKNGDFTIQRTVIQGGQDQAGGPNLFDGPRPHHFEGRHRGHHDPQMFNRPQFDNDYENPYGCENECGDGNYDFDNSDIERFLTGGLNNNAYNNNAYNNNAYNNELGNNTYVIYTGDPNNTEPEPALKQESQGLNDKIRSLEAQIAELKRGKEGVPDSEKAEDKALMDKLAKKYNLGGDLIKKFNDSITQPTQIAPQPVPEKKQPPQELLITPTQIKHKPAKKEHHHHPHSHKPINEMSIYKPGAIQNHMLGLPEGTKYEPLFSKPIDTRKCH